MGKHQSSPSGRRKISKRNRGMELLCAIARPPQERWSIRERINFRIALGRFGQDWPRVAHFISSKTTDQICVYAHEYFQKQQPKDNLAKKLPSDVQLALTPREQHFQQQ